MKRDPRIAVVVLTHDRVDEVMRTVARMRALPEQPRLIVVDNASSDGTVARLAREEPDVEVVALGRNVGAAGRNAGVARTDRPYVAFCDDDTWWAPGSLARAADLLDAHPSLAAVTARILVGREEREDPTCRVMAASPLPRVRELPGIPILGFMAGATMLRRAAFLAVGGFERRLFLGYEETLVALDLAAAGWAMAYVPELVVHHHPSSLRDRRRRRRLLVRNALWLAWLRRPVRAALRRTWREVHEARPRWMALVGFAEALRGLPWVLRHRRVLPAEVELAVRLIERRARPPGGAGEAARRGSIGSELARAPLPPEGR